MRQENVSKYLHGQKLSDLARRLLRTFVCLLHTKKRPFEELN